MREPPPAGAEQAYDCQHESHGPVVATVAERLAKPPWEVDRDEIAAEQLQTAVRRDSFVRERDGEIVLDVGSNPVSTQPHDCGSSVYEWSVVTPSCTPSEPLSISFCHRAQDCPIGARNTTWPWPADAAAKASR